MLLMDHENVLQSYISFISLLMVCAAGCIIIARRAIVFADYRQGQGKGCVNRVRASVCLSVCTQSAQCWFLKGSSVQPGACCL